MIRTLRTLRHFASVSNLSGMYDKIQLPLKKIKETILFVVNIYCCHLQFLDVCVEIEQHSGHGVVSQKCPDIYPASTHSLEVNIFGNQDSRLSIILTCCILEDPFYMSCLGCRVGGAGNWGTPYPVSGLGRGKYKLKNYTCIAVEYK